MTNKKADLVELEWRRTAYHVAGHVIARDALGLPDYDPRIEVRTPMLWGKPRGYGSTPPMPPRGSSGQVDAYLISCFAGPEAEAVVVQTQQRVSAGTARRRAYQWNRDGDHTRIGVFARRAGIRRRQARRQARKLIAANWVSVESYALVLLANHRRRSGRG